MWEEGEERKTDPRLLHSIVGPIRLLDAVDTSESAPPFGPSVSVSAQIRDIPDPLIFGLQILLRPTEVQIVQKGAVHTTLWIPGHTVGGPWGPDPRARVMLIGKMPWQEETAEKRLLAGPSGALVEQILRDAGVDYAAWYVTNVLRFMPPGQQKNVRAEWLTECRWFLHQELSIIRPEHILLFGTDVVKELFGKSTNVTKLRGVEGLEYAGAKVTVTVHPSAVLKSPTLMSGFRDDLLSFCEKATGKRVVKRAPVSYECITTEGRLAEVVDQLIREGHRTFSVDAEWGGHDRSDFINGQLRMIQLSYRTHQSYGILLRSEGLVDRFEPSPAAAIPHLRRLLCRPDVRIGGHNFRADLKFLMRIGLDLREQHRRGFDTALAYHVLHPSEGKDAGLEVLALRYTDLGRYDWPLEEWKKRTGFKESTTQGYRDIPDHILAPYAMADTDAVMRIWPILEKKLRAQPFGQSETYEHPARPGHTFRTMYDVYEQIEHGATLALNRMEMTGFPVDENRLRDLADLFRTRLAELEADFRKFLGWPTFNFRSHYQVRELLFGFSSADVWTARQEHERNVRAGVVGRNARPPYIRYLPPDVQHFGLRPVKTTEKPSRDWVAVPDAERTIVNASTDGETLKILAAQDERVARLSELRFVDQIVKTYLRYPDEDKEGDVIIDEQTGEEVYSTGLLGKIDPDGRIRTTISQLTDTGRYRSCVHEDTLIRTRRGRIPIKDVRVGDYVWTHRRRWKKVLRTYVYPADKMWDFSLSNREVLTCVLLHRVLSCDNNWKEMRNAERVKEAYARRGTCGPRRGRISIRHGYRRRHRRAERRKRSYCPCDDSKNGARQYIQQAKTPSVRKIKNWQKEPAIWKKENVAGLRRWARLPNTPSRRKKIFRTSDRVFVKNGHTPFRISGMAGHTPYRRRPSEQRYQQPGGCDKQRPSPHTRAVQTHARGLEIEACHYSGVYPVYDLYVEDDHSYEACGIFHHNSSPNLQNIPKRQEAELRRIFATDIDRLKELDRWESRPLADLKAAGLIDPRYQTIRSCFCALPGQVLIEADYRQAEMFVLAYRSGDSNLKAVMNDPSRDLHSEIAVKGLRLNCSATEVKKKYPQYRDAAKATNYGILYGRGAPAVVRALLMQGVVGVTEADAEALKDALFGECPLVYEYIEACKRASVSPGYVENPFGRRRYFPFTEDRAVQAQQARQAVNAPIQGAVADVISLALDNLYVAREGLDESDRFELLLTVHDSILFSCPVHMVEPLTAEIIPTAMCKNAAVPNIGLEIPIDIEMGLRWGDKMKQEDAIRAAQEGMNNGIQR